MRKLVIAAAALLALASGPAAHATLQFAATINGTNFFCADGAACDQDPTAGSLLLLNGLNVGGVVSNSSLSMSALGAATLNSASFSLINLNPFSVTIDVAVGDNGFTGPRHQFSFAGSGTFQNAVGGSVTDSWFNDPQNAQPATTQVGPLSAADTPGNELSGGGLTHNATLISDAFAFNSGGVQTLAIPDLTDFSMTLGFHLVLPGSPDTCTAAATATCAQLVGRSNTLVKFDVPEPMTLGLLGSGLVALGMIRRRRRV